jgi:hypothetical protein
MDPNFEKSAEQLAEDTQLRPRIEHNLIRQSSGPPTLGRPFC